MTSRTTRTTTRKRGKGLLPSLVSSLLLVVLVSISTLIPLTSASPSTRSLLAIDYGTDSFKASLVKPGVPFDVLLTKEGKRKISSSSTIRNLGKDRFVGQDSSSLFTRFPGDTVNSVKLLLGHGREHEQSRLHARLFGLRQTTTTNERGGGGGSPAVLLDSMLKQEEGEDNGGIPVEEVLAMEFQFAKELAQEQTDSIKESVITVPGWFGEKERRSILDAAEIAGLRVVGLINDGTAVAVNYAMTRTFPSEPSYHLIYDLGSGSLKVSLVSFKSEMLPDPLSLSETPTLRNTTIVTVHGYGWNFEIGGYRFDEIVREILIKGAQETINTTGGEIRQDKRAMAKLLKEAIRVKQVLSANTQASSRIEGLINDLDFKFTVTRQEFEDECSREGLLPKLIQPIEQALESCSNLSLEKDIESLIFVGGSSRVPLVQESVSNFLQGSDTLIAKNVNADEAAVLGAGLYGAGVIRGFRTKDIRVRDLYPFGIDVTYQSGGQGGEEEVVTELLFPKNSNTPIKKTLTLKNQTKDFNLDFNDHESREPIFSTTLTGISSTISNTNLTVQELENSSVTVVVELDESGLLKIGKATLILREEEGEGSGEGEGGEGGSKSGMTEKLKNLFNKFGSNKSEEGGGEPTTEADHKNDNSSSTTNSSTSLTEEERKELEEYLMKSKLPPAKTKLTVETVQPSKGGGGGGGVVMMSNEEKSQIKKRLRDAKTHLHKKLAREEARNSLESFVYKVRDYLEYNESFTESSVESERKSIRELNEKTSEWLSEEGEFAKTNELKEKKRELEKLVKHVLNRSIESSTRPNLITKLEQLLTSSTSFHSSALSNQTLTTPSRFTTEELTNLEKLLQETKNWLGDLIKKQSKLKLYMDPVLKVSDLEKKIKSLETEVKRLEKKKLPRASTKKKVGKKEESQKKEEEEKGETKSGQHKKDEL